MSTQWKEQEKHPLFRRGIVHRLFQDCINVYFGFYFDVAASGGALQPFCQQLAAISVVLFTRWESEIPDISGSEIQVRG